MGIRFFGLPAAHVNWSLDEDAVSTDRSLAPSGVPQAQVSGVGDGDVLGLKGKPLIADSLEYGRTTLTASASTQTPATWSITADTALSGFNKSGSVKPVFQKPLTECFATFTAAAKVTGLKLQVDSALSSVRCTVPATDGNVWGNLRMWLSANELDICFVFDTVVLYPMRTHVLFARDVTSDWTVSIDDAEQVGTVRTYVYHREAFTNGVVYPPRATRYPLSEKHFGSQDAPNVISVGANETATAEIDLGAEVSSLGNPTHLLSIPMKNGAVDLDTTTYPNGIYSVVGQDNKPITPEQWKAEGGSITVELQPNGHTAKVTVVGANNAKLAPFRIAESDGQNDYAALYLVAPSGQYVDIEQVDFTTGSTDSDEIREIDNPAIDTLTKAYRAAQDTADVTSGYTCTLQWSGGDPVRSPFKDFALDWAIRTPTAKDATAFTGSPLPAKAEVAWPDTTTMQKIDSDLHEFVKDSATKSTRRQSFGRAAGARFYLRGFWWRVTAVSWSDGGVSITGQVDNTVSDLARKYATINDWDIPAEATLLEISTRGIL